MRARAAVHPKARLFRVTPQANADGGTTSAIYAYPSAAIGTPATAQLWVGTAVIDRASAYSFFADRQRVHVPIHGNGLRLHFQNLL